MTYISIIGDTLDGRCNLLFVYFLDRNVHGKEGREECEGEHGIEQFLWELQLEGELQEQEELSCANGCKYEADARAQDKWTCDHNILFVHENAQPLCLIQSNGSQATVFPNILLNVLRCRDHKQKEGEDEGNGTNDTNKDLE